MSVHKGEISSVTTIWLLPIVPAVICSATGAMVAGELNNSAHALWTLVVSYVLWGIGLPLAMFTLVLYYYRLTIHNIPAPALISSAFLPLGPLGEGGFAIMKMGQVSLTIFSATDTFIPDSGKIVYTSGFLTALLLWGFGLAWLSWAMMSFVRPTTEFNMGWWSIVFATGVFAGSTITLGQEMNSRFFNVLGTVSFPCLLRLNLGRGAQLIGAVGHDCYNYCILDRCARTNCPWNNLRGHVIVTECRAT